MFRSMFRSLTYFLCFLLVVPAVTVPAFADRPAPQDPASFDEKTSSWEHHREMEKSSIFRGLPWRSIGPVVMGGRIVDVENVPGEPYSFYVAYASGGLWKTTNNGVTFDPLFDDQSTIIMGDLAIDPQNPKTIWVGTGEDNSSRSSYGGMGIFRSDDGGETWQNKGLGESDRIARVLVDPRDSKRVYAAVLGKLYTEGGQRGVYRTDDGGENWEQILTPDGGPMTGAIDLVMHPENPDILYTATWERSRRPWNFVEGGPGSGIWKSTDGGDTWARLEGFPQGEMIGRIGLAIAPSQPDTLYAVLDNQEVLPEELWDMGDSAINPKRLRTMTKEEFLAQDPEAIEDFIRGNDLDTALDAEKLIEMVENDEVTMQDILDEVSDANANLFSSDIKGLEVYRTDDAGVTWKRTHEDPLREVVYTYGYYFGRIHVAPDDPDRIYTYGVPIVTSGDGGKTWEGINGRDVHVDYHDMWIDPDFSDRAIVGNDGGLDMTYDGGKSWIKLDSQPVGQFYSVAVDMAEPYNVYGGLQDNGVFKGSSQGLPALDPWQRVGGGDGMYVQIDPRDNQTTYWGFQFGYYFRVGPGGGEMVRPRDKMGDPALRYNWQTPIQLSTHNPDVLYFGANILYRSMNQGETWTPISPDLTRSEQRGDVPYATMTSLSESELQFGLIWAGTDDGYVHVTKGGDWADVSAGLPKDRWVTRVEASHYNEERAYVSLAGYRDDDIAAYVYKTDDLGKTWTSIAEGLPAEAVNVVREDPVNEDVLYVGTDRGAYVSLDRGASWQALDASLPNVPVHDLVVHPRERELVAGTHGRSVWIVDVLPVQELAAVRDEAVHVFPLENVSFYGSGRPSRWFHFPESDPKVDIPFWSAEAGTATLRILDSDGRELWHTEQPIEAAGIHVMSWDQKLDEKKALRAEEARLAAADEGKEEKKGKKKKQKKQKEAEEAKAPEKGANAKTPWAETLRLGRPLYATPGTYTVEITVGEASATAEIEVDKPRPREPRAKKKAKIRGEK